MSVHSASAHHPTPQLETRLSREDVGRLVLSWTCGLVGVAGFLSLFWLFAAVANHGPVTTRSLVLTALAATATVCGMFGAGLSINAQRAADRLRKQREQHEDELDEMRAIREEIREDRAARAEFAELMRRFLEHEDKVNEQSAQARANVAKIHDDVSELRAAVGMVTQEMPTANALLGTLRAYIDTLFQQFSKHVAEAEARGERRGAARAERRAPRQNRGQRGGSRPDVEDARPGVSRLPSADVLRDARGLARRVIRGELRRAEDNSEDRA